MEFGPRALGARSIIGDARSPEMQEIMNLKIKFRESFRPFAPSVLKEKAADFFDIDTESPYMLIVAPVKENIRRAMTKEDRDISDWTNCTSFVRASRRYTCRLFGQSANCNRGGPSTILRNDQ